MATIEGYGGRFIGNDFVRPQMRRPVMRDVVQARPAVAARPQYAPRQTQYVQRPVQQAPVAVEAYTQSAAEDFSAQLEPVAQANRTSRITNMLTLRNGIIAGSALILVTGLVFAVPRMSAIWHTSQTVAHRVALGASVDLHHTQPAKYVMPQNSILVKSSQLSTFVDAIEGQEIDITVGDTTVTPKPLDLQNWFTTTAGPQSNSTIIEPNTANIAAYLSSVAKQHGAPGADVSAATAQLAGSLLKYSGATVTLAD